METPASGRAPASLRACAAATALFGLTLALSPGTSAQADDLWTRSNLLGDPSGVRSALGTDGITLSAQDTETLLGNVAGGLKQGATMQGVTTVTLQVDTGKAFNVQGGTFNASALQIHGRPLTPYYLDDLQAASGTEADNTTRLWELWYDQSFAYGRADVKIGQQSIDNEFMASKYSALFVNTMAGWPLVPSDDLYAGGPAYPLSSLGVRLQAKPTDNQTVLVGVFDDNPPGGSFNNDPQSLDDGGIRFNLHTGALFIAEYQYAVNQPAIGQMAYGNEQTGLPGTYKIGFWYDTAPFPASDGSPAMHRNNYSFYGVVDQTVWRQAPGSPRTLNVFARVMGAPGDRNLISFAFNGGVTLTDPLPGRDNDQVGIDIGVGKLSDDAAVAAGATPGVETLIELTYQYQATPWWLIQPDLQYVINPGGGVPDPNHPTRQLRNEMVVGVRTAVTF
ncbi:MAG: carbohydrate porin [Acetobacteraceae bacterium]